MYTCKSMLETEIKNRLFAQGAAFVRMVDLSVLPKTQTREYTKAIVFGIALSDGYIREINTNPDHLKNLKASNGFDHDEFHVTEVKTDRMANDLAIFLNDLGYLSFSQSEKSIEKEGYYNANQKRSILPHKTLAWLAGLGWIGKHNLLVSPSYGCALSMCTVLTNAPIQTESYDAIPVQCGQCNTCVSVCETSALSGETWSPNKDRDDLLNVQACTTCLKCMMICPYNFRKANVKISSFN